MSGIVLVFTMASMVCLLLGDLNSAQAQNITNMTAMSGEMVELHEKHVLDKLIISQNIPLRGHLTVGDYILLMDLTPFATSVEGHNHIALKIPCNEKGMSELAIFTGVSPNLKTLDLGKGIDNGTLDGRNFDLSDEGKSCLYHEDLPNGVTDILLSNTSNHTINFDEGSYSVTLSIHGTAMQHLAANAIEK
jgi:hypothetical protein